MVEVARLVKRPRQLRRYDPEISLGTLIGVRVRGEAPEPSAPRARVTERCFRVRLSRKSQAGAGSSAAIGGEFSSGAAG
jgi:hypothetical protein